MVGYIAKREHTAEKGPHIHTVFIYDGQKVSKDAFKGDQIGEYWKNEITDGKGIYHNCNREKAKYAECALGMIDHTDEAKRTVLKERLLPTCARRNRTSTRSSNQEMSGHSPVEFLPARRAMLGDLDCTIRPMRLTAHWKTRAVVQ